MSEGKLSSTPLRRKTQNQYTTETEMEKYTWILSNCIEYSPPEDVNNIIKCWIPNPNAVGMQYDATNNQFRFSNKGKYDLVHVFTSEFIKGSKGTLDASHLCHNRRCCRPSHITFESRTDNIARVDCPGYIIVEGRLYKVCTHYPPCKRVFTAVARSFLKELMD